MTADKKPSDTYFICTGTYYESPDYCGDESDYYSIGIESTKFYGTLEEARDLARDLRRKRSEDYERNLVSVYSWITDSSDNRV